MQDDPEVNVSWHNVLSYYRALFFSLFFFSENTVTTDIYVNMLELFALLHIYDFEQEESEILFLQDSVPPHFSHEVLNGLDVRFPNWWIGSGRPTPLPT